ncbi:MAG: LLM class flavin-dependent oxidoreductase [Pseudomonadota bacterium]
MSLRLGYLLPTRENIMNGEPSGKALLDAARMAADLGFDSVWAGDSLMARPRHDPLTLLSAVAGAINHIEVGTAVLLPVLRNPVVLAQQLATLDQISEGRFIAGIGIAADNTAIRSEFRAAGVTFEKRIGTLMESFRLWRALWSGETVSWDGRWTVEGELAPTPYREGGPRFWLGTGVTSGIERAAKHFDGWMPLGPDAETFGRRRDIYLQSLEREGRSPDDMTTAVYLTVAVKDDAMSAEQDIDHYLERYYSVPAPAMRKVQACCGGPLPQVMGFIRGFVEQGAQHIVLRIVGDHDKTLNQIAANRDDLAG